MLLEHLACMKTRNGYFLLDTRDDMDQSLPDNLIAGSRHGKDPLQNLTIVVCVFYYDCHNLIILVLSVVLVSDFLLTLRPAAVLDNSAVFKNILYQPLFFCD